MSGRPIRVLELRSVRGTGGGPEKTILLGALRSDPAEVHVTVCYIRDLRDGVFTVDRRAAAMQVPYIEVQERHSFDPAIMSSLRRIVRERQIEIVHAHDYKTNVIAWLLARVERVIPFTTAHGWSGASRRERLYYWFDRRLIARFPVAVAVSEPIRQALIAAGARPDHVRRVPNGVDHECFRPDPAARARLRRSLRIPANAVVVGTIGRLEGEKRHDLLIEAVAGLDVALRPLVVCAGDGSRREAVVAAARQRDLADRLMLLGHREDVRDVHQMLDVYVQASDREGLPNAVLEALAVGTPVVATAVGGTSELIQDGVDGLLVPPGDAGALRLAIHRTLCDPDAALRRAAAARDRIEREWSFARRMAAVNALYRELIDRRDETRGRMERCA